MDFGPRGNVRDIGSAKLTRHSPRPQRGPIPKGGAEIIPLGPLIQKTWGACLKTQIQEVNQTLESFGMEATPESATLMICFIHDLQEKGDVPPSQLFRHCRTYVFSDYEKRIDLYVGLCTRAASFGIVMPVFERGLFRVMPDLSEQPSYTETIKAERLKRQNTNVVSLDVYRRKKK